jgi:hypothetical protein
MLKLKIISLVSHEVNKPNTQQAVPTLLVAGCWLLAGKRRTTDDGRQMTDDRP